MSMNIQEPTPAVPAQNSGVSGLAISSLVIGIVAILLSFIPIINNFAFVLAIVGIVLAIVSLVLLKKSSKGGQKLAIAGLVLGIVAIVVTLAVQFVATKALESAGDALEKGMDGPTAVATGKAQGGEGEKSTQQKPSEPLAVGTSVTLENGLVISVDSVNLHYKDTIDEEYVMINVTYTNKGKEKQDYNSWDWKGLTDQGAEKDATFAMPDDSVKSLDSGSLTPGGTVSGSVFFEPGVVSANFYSNIFSDKPASQWKLS